VIVDRAKSRELVADRRGALVLLKLDRLGELGLERFHACESIGSLLRGFDRGSGSGGFRGLSARRAGALRWLRGCRGRGGITGRRAEHARALADVVRAAFMRAGEERGELPFKGLVALGAAEEAALAELREGEAAARALGDSGGGASRCCAGSGRLCLVV
jgi:hypothetical protein